MFKKAQTQPAEAQKPYMSTPLFYSLGPVAGLMGAGMVFMGAQTSEILANHELAAPMAEKVALGIYGADMVAAATTNHYTAKQIEQAQARGAAKIDELKIRYNTECKKTTPDAFDAKTGEGSDIYLCPVKVTAQLVPAMNGDAPKYKVSYQFNQTKAASDALMEYRKLHMEADAKIATAEGKLQTAAQIKENAPNVAFAGFGVLALTLLGQGAAGLIRRREYGPA